MDRNLVVEITQLPSTAATIGAMIRTAENNEPHTGSAGWHEREVESNFAAPKPWGDTPVFEAHSQAILRLAVAEDHLYGLQRVLNEPILAFSPLTVCRGVLEASGRAWWTLEPGLDVSLRVCRAMNERYYSLIEQGKMPINDEKIERSRSRAQGLVECAEGLSLPVVRDRNQRVIAIGDRERPTSTELIEALLQTAGLGDVTYRWTSGTAHATLYGIMSQVTAAEDTDTPGVRQGLLEASDTSIVMASALSVLAYTDAFNRAVALFDWSTDDWRAFKRRSEMTIRKALIALDE